jgi:lipopolysaccharide biosynthesis glycosyltransferase
MNSIFCCVFNQDKYVDMFFLLLESIFIYGDLDCNTHILIYTSTQFMNRIKQSHLFNDEKIKFEINDTYNDVGKACKARLDLFNLPSIINYNKILYLDTDILVKDDLNKVFNVCKEDILYVLEEALLTDDDNWYGGKTLFGNEINNYNDKSAFTSGILLFNNCENIKNLFNKINEDIVKRPYYFDCYDQPYIVYNAFKYNLYNNKILKSLVVNNDNNIHSDKVIHHFPGGPGVYQHKIDAMNIFLNSLKNQYKIFIEQIISNGFTLVQKISIFDNRNEMIKYYCDKISNPKILEIGVFKGDFLEYLVKECNIGSVDCVDLFEGITCSGDVDGNNVIYYDVGKSYLELSEKYKDVLNIRLYKSNSITFLQNQEDNKYDIIYIDGDHSYNGVKNDLTNAYNKIQNGGYIMGHDYEMNMKKAKNIYDFGVKKAVDEFCINYKQTIISKANDGCVSFCIHINKI